MEVLKLKKITHIIFAIVTLLLISTNMQAQKRSSCMSGDCKNGPGLQVWENGERYEGWFKNGMRDGYGFMTYENGNTYIGEWSENLRYGHGGITFKDHEVKVKYVGEWKANNIQGYGSLHLKRNKYQIGYWNKNQFNAIDKVNVCLEGDCENGWGTFIFKDQSLYIGEFKEGLRHGQGTQIYKMGSKYKGTHKDGKRNGFGIYYYLNGNKYEGEWKNDKKFGGGKLYKQGKLDHGGVWENNILITKIKPNDVKMNNLPSADKKAPTIEIIEPSVSRGPIVVSKKKRVRIFGKVTDQSGVSQVRVSGAVATLSQEVGDTREFEAYVLLAEKQNDFWVEATDTKGNVIKIDFTIVYEKENETIPSDLSDKPPIINSNDKAPRTALVIGNSTYSDAPLRNPMNDANSMAKKLTKLGFDVTLELNIKQRDLKTVIRDFGKKLKAKGGVGLFYYAGHGIQFNGDNYLVPVNADIEKQLDVEVEAVKLQRVLNELEHANNQMNIVILDACRDNPYANLRSASGKGLAPVYGAPLGTFIAYATSPGQAASDGNGNHGLYTQELLGALDKSSGMKIEDLFKVVRAQVRQKSDGKQIPWENSSLEGNFIINPKK